MTLAWQAFVGSLWRETDHVWRDLRLLLRPARTQVPAIASHSGGRL